MADWVNHLPMFAFMLIGFVVGTLQLRKARRFVGLKKTLALAVSAFTYLPAVTILAVVIGGAYDKGWPGVVIVFSILLAIAIWTASLIWAGPAEAEDKAVFISTVAIMVLMIATVLGALLLGLVP